MSSKWILRFSCLAQIAGLGILWVFEAVRMKDLGVGETTIGLILGYSSGVTIVGSLFWARLADRHHAHKRVVIWGSISFAAVMWYFSFSTQVWHFVVYASIKSFIAPMVMGVMPAMAVKAFEGARRGRSFGIYRAFGSLGFMIGSMVLPLVLNDIVRVAQVGSLLILASVLLVRQLPEPDIKPAKLAPLKFRGVNPIIKLFLLSFFFIAMSEPAVHGFFSAYARQLGGSTRLLGMLSGFMGLVALLSLPLIGKWIDRINPTHILTASFLAQAIRVWINSTIGEVEFLWIPILLHGLCWGGVEVAAVVYLSSLASEGHKATVLSYYLSVRMLGQLFGSGLSGYLAEHAGYIVMFRTLSAVAFLGTVIFVLGSYRPRMKAVAQS